MTAKPETTEKQVAIPGDPCPNCHGIGAKAQRWVRLDWPKPAKKTSDFKCVCRQCEEDARWFIRHLGRKGVTMRDLIL